MRAPKGFGKNYFTLAAIQATVVQHHLSATSVRVQASHLIQPDWETKESEDEELEELFSCATLSLPTHAGHCNCYYNSITRNRIRHNRQPKQRVEPYIYANSVTSPPILLSTSYSKYLHNLGKTMTKIVLSLAALSAFTSIASAADTVVLEPLTISSTAIETDELKSTDAVEVYTAEEIEKAHVQNVYEFLNQQTSVIAMPSYGNPFMQKIDMRGYGIGDGYQNIVITLNGRRMNNIDMVPQLLASISPASIEKIEIIKSSGIVTGGDGANAGVINITTKKSNDREVTLYGGTYLNNDNIAGFVDGGYVTKDASFYTGYADDLFSVSATGEYQKNDGIRDLDAAGNKDENQLKTGAVDLSITPIKELAFRLSGSSTRANINYAGSLTLEQYEENPFQAGSSYTIQDYDTNVVSAGASYYITDTLSLNLDANHEKKISDNTAVYFGTPYGFRADYQYDSLTASLDYESDVVALSAGINGFKGARDAHPTSYSLANTTTKENLAAFLMTEWYFGKSTLKAGYRYETVNYTYEDIGPSTQEKHQLHGVELGYNYQFAKTQSLFANYAHSYQAPDIDRFFTYGSFNAFIKPMQANNYTLGYNSITPANKFKLALYYIDLKDEIYYYKDTVNVYPSPSLSVNTNIDRSSKYGVDLYDKWLLSPSFNIILNYNYVQATIDEETGRNGEDYAGKTLPGVSNHNAKVTFSYLPNPFTALAITEVYRSAAYALNDFDNDFAQRQEAYNSTDISATFTKENYELFAKINNLFNQKNGLWIQDNAIYPLNFTLSGIVGMKLKF